jgi:hypothetical protein
MKLTNGKMEEYIHGLDGCREATGYPGMLIGIVHRRIRTELREYLTEKQRIFEKYGTLQKDTGRWYIDSNSPGYPDAIREIAEISGLESEVDIPQFSEDEFVGKFQSDILTAKNYDVLYDIFVKKEGK